MSVEDSELRSLQIPNCYSSRQKAWRTIEQCRCGVSPISVPDSKQITRIIATLHSEKVTQMITAGRLTIGLIKPNAHEGRNLPPDDEQAAEVLLGLVGRERLAFHLPFALSRSEAELFYASLREEYREKFIAQRTRYNDFGKLPLFEAITRFTTSGPLTVLFIDGEDAVTYWRTTMGKTNPEQADPWILCQTVWSTEAILLNQFSRKKEFSLRR